MWFWAILISGCGNGMQFWWMFWCKTSAALGEHVGAWHTHNRVAKALITQIIYLLTTSPCSLFSQTSFEDSWLFKLSVQLSSVQLLSRIDTCIFSCKGFPGGWNVKKKHPSATPETWVGSIPGSGRSPGAGHGNPLQYSCLENPHGQRSLAVHSPQGHKESDMTEWLSIAQHIFTEKV